jgi:hypothetical protein
MRLNITCEPYTSIISRSLTAPPLTTRRARTDRHDTSRTHRQAYAQPARTDKHPDNPLASPRRPSTVPVRTTRPDNPSHLPGVHRQRPHKPAQTHPDHRVRTDHERHINPKPDTSKTTTRSAPVRLSAVRPHNQLVSPARIMEYRGARMGGKHRTTVMLFIGT